MNRLPFGCLSLILIAGLIALIPLFLANAVLTALAKLGLSPATSLLVAVGIFLGGLVNIPVRRIPREETIEHYPLGIFGVGRFFPRMVTQQSFTIIAVNLGGCVIPCLLVAYELSRIASAGGSLLLATAAASAINIAACWRLARPVPNVGIALPAFIPALLAAACALLFARQMAPPVAFTAGVLGPLVGADLLHLRDLGKLTTGMGSIGGAGTFDGIVLSGLVATLIS